MRKYILTSTIYHAEMESVFYGVALIEQDGNSYELIEAFNDLTQEKANVENLINECNKLGLEKSQLNDIVCDLIIT